MWPLFPSFHRPKVKAQQRVLEHMILWHKHQFNCTTLIRPWIDDWRGSEGVTTEVWLLEDSFSSSTRAQSKRLLSPDPTPNAETKTFCFVLFSPSSFNVYGSSVLTARCFLLCHNFTVMPVVLAGLQQYMVSANGVQSRGILSLLLGWKWRHTVKFKQEEMVVIFYLTASQRMTFFVEWHPPCKQPKANRKEWLVMQLWLNTVLSYHQVVRRFNRNIWKKKQLIFRAIFMYNRKWLLDFYCSNVVLTCSYTLDPLTI